MGYDYSYPIYCLLERCRQWQYRYRLKKTYRSLIRRKKRKNRKTVFLVLTPEHENLGDHAIALAEIQMLRKLGADYVEITGAQLERLEKEDLLGIMNGYPILINGGGNLGTLWFDVEKLQREIIRKNPKSKIMILPNTMFYEDSEWGRNEFQEAIALYCRHKGLFVYAREKTTYRALQKVYRNVKWIPDMVLSLNESGAETERHGCLICLRGDLEKTRTETQEREVRLQMEKLFGSEVRDTDTIAEVCVPVAQREEALRKKFAEFAGAELVVTDRLHGMIFCAITGTPCIVLDSKSPKVRGCYEWIRDLEYIRFAEDASQIAEIYEQIPKKRYAYDSSRLAHYYQELADDIVDFLHWR